ncbi:MULTISPECIES: thiol-disulfide oxidoreductase DCC family protein [Stenotrophomonas]|uniref:thiol-disulfide oxidoreductase DCC family protein n=1 Tax=Stenotrophomonas TaxID=40323 RepID=UPI0018D28A1D|nr:thiol-disulfide oxidoreductase DCC family protein [Stenotrophomonas sp. SMYL89]MBH1410714.1 thiol-disulfide oxidoreductase DCC family protein [Stenotrophomonas maltophilia]HDS1300524.1 thiol-disulfide oxidoreductase DCC family protein [Stenotrophomonas maltophilia]HDS1523339.1 thiol-disulfide oxidoreductase DCC family protein [Stenotrophomonas maltophilia]HDS1657911.1 thiol-disulfide oxidoreductase DCC family protein [Stenotrophomonas maltophilia]HDS1662569.1 thiol-disulfide oxidoreductase 
MKAGSNRSEVATETGRAVIVFDGVCALCNQWVRFLLRFDRAGRYRFAAMQGTQGSALLRAHGLDPQDPASFLLLDAQGAWTDTDAILRVLAGLGGAWRFSGVLRLLPRSWRDAAYRLLARNRYRWFGRHDACHLPAPEHLARFLD